MEESKNECMIFGNYVAIHQVNGKKIHDLLEILTTVSTVFPALKQYLTIAMTLKFQWLLWNGVFPHFVEPNLICAQVCLRSQDRLDNLPLPNIERDLTNELWENLEILLVKFVQKHGNSKISSF